MPTDRARRLYLSLAVLAWMGGHALAHPGRAAAQAAPVAKPAVLTLAPDDKAEVMLVGDRIETFTLARVVDRSGRAVSGFTLRLGQARGDERPLLVSATGARGGRYAVQLTAGRTVVSPTLELVVEVTDAPPEVVDVAVPDPLRPGLPFSVTVVARDDREVASVVVAWAGGQVSRAASGPEVKLGVDLPALPDGVTEVVVTAVDVAGARSAPRAVRLHVEAAPDPPAPVGPADLVVASFSGPSSVAVGEQFGSRVTLRVRNAGSVAVPAGASIPIGFYVSTDPLIDTSDRLLQGGRENLGAALGAELAPGAEVDVPLNPIANVSPTFPDAQPPTGSLYLGVLLDEFGALEEVDEANNSTARPLTVRPAGADLAVATFDGPSSVTVGEQFGSRVTLRVRNAGSVAVPAGTSIPIGFYVSTDPVIDASDRLLQGGRENLGAALTGELGPGAEVDVPLNPAANVSPTFPDAEAPTGPLDLGVLLDEFGALDELEKANNSAARPLTVRPAGADLVVASFSGPSSVTVGEQFGSRVTLRVRNAGSVAVPAGTSIPIGFYVSTDPVIDASDRLLQGGRENLSSVLTGELGPGAEVDVPLNPIANVSATFPDADPPTGSLYLGVLLDEFGALDELDETNNSAVRPVTVVPPGSGPG